MKLCKDCTYFERASEYCFAPQLGMNPVNGKIKSTICTLNRITLTHIPGKTCGAEGNWFVLKEIKKEAKPWWKFWS